MYAQSHESNAAQERNAVIRKQAAEIEALKIENSKLRRNYDVANVAVSALVGETYSLPDDLDPAVARGDHGAILEYLEENLSEV